MRNALKAGYNTYFFKFIQNLLAGFFILVAVWEEERKNIFLFLEKLLQHNGSDLINNIKCQKAY